MEVSPFLTASFMVILFLSRFNFIEGQTQSFNQSSVPALLVFGDSLADPGNNNGLPTLAKSNFPPYGRDFVGRKATGRFSNGKLATDFIVSALGIKDTLPAYLDPELKQQDLLTGVSFASGGSGFDTLTAKITLALPIKDQLYLFKKYIGQLKTIAGEVRAANIVSQSLYLVSAGSNDLMITYFDVGIRKIKYDVSSYVDVLVEDASNLVQDLYRLGARKIFFVGLTPLGCVPAERTLKGGSERNCVDPLNQAALQFNFKLSIKLQMLSAQLSGTRLSLVDIYNWVNDIIERPFAYGMQEATRGCCGTGQIEAAILCNKLSPNTCPDASKYVFWDGFHPTEKVYEIVAAKIGRSYLSAIHNGSV